MGFPLVEDIWARTPRRRGGEEKGTVKEGVIRDIRAYPGKRRCFQSSKEEKGQKPSKKGRKGGEGGYNNNSLNQRHRTHRKSSTGHPPSLSKPASRNNPMSGRCLTGQCNLRPRRAAAKLRVGELERPGGIVGGKYGP